MVEQQKEVLKKVEILDYNPQWADAYLAERRLLLATVRPSFVELEHIGSTAVPGLRAKPIIDLMVAVPSLQDRQPWLGQLERVGYELIETDMQNRLFLRKIVSAPTHKAFHLHVVEQSTWLHRKERLMRDYLLRNPQDAKAYAAEKDRLAAIHPDDAIAYTVAKTAFIQGLFNKIYDDLRLPRIDAWSGE
jgi:GrpB-like predicted nucleotidyltransferase (UPF0157 family)